MAAALLIAGFVRLLVFVLLEVVLLRMVLVAGFVVFALAHALLVGLVLGIIRFVVLIQRGCAELSPAAIARIPAKCLKLFFMIVILSVLV